jgi:hypothetical protein
MRPPQQKPVMPSRVVSPSWGLAQATQASRSAMTWPSGTFDTTLAMSSGMSPYCRGSPWRAYSSGAMALVAQLGQAAADGLSPVGRHVAVGGGHLDFACREACAVGADGGLGHHRLHGERKARAQGSDQKAAPGEGLGWRNQTVQFCGQRVDVGVHGVSFGGG